MAGIAINGLGRVGRAALKILEKATGEVNDAFREGGDNEWGFTCQMTREAFTALGLPAPDLAQVRP